MNTFKTVIGGSALLFFGALAANAFAAEGLSSVDFVEEASAKGIAEIETGKLALEKSSNNEVRKFAQKMIDDHTKANEELAKIAAEKNLEVADNAELLNRIKTTLLKARSDVSFDVSYAQNQVTAHEQTIELFERAARISDPELKAFAQKTLPKLQDHLNDARKLAVDTEKAYRDSPDYRDVVPGTQPAPR